jgi:excisionase family DNA binding protein
MTTKLNHTITQFCELLNVSRSTAYRLIKAGQIRVVRIGDRPLVPDAELKSFQRKLRRSAHPVRQDLPAQD